MVLATTTSLTYADLLPCLCLEREVFRYPRHYVQRNGLLPDGHGDDIIRIELILQIVACLFQDLTGECEWRAWENIIAIRTSRIAQRCLGSCSLILPFGNPHPADDRQPLTSTHCSRGQPLRKRENYPRYCAAHGPYPTGC